MLERRALKSRAHALAITAVLVLGVFAAIVLASNSPVAPARQIIASAQAAPAQRAIANRDANSDAVALHASLPLYFEPNVGQTDPRVRFLTQSGRYSLFLTDDAATFSLVGGQIHKGPVIATVNPPRPPDRLVESAVRIRMLGANPHPAMHALEPLPGRVNYLIGNDPAKFHRNVPTYGRVRVAGIYPGIDVVYYGMPSALEYDIVAAPGADTSLIHFAVEGDARTAVDSSGNLRITTAAGTIAMHRPHAYQRAADGSKIPVASSFVTARRGEYAIQLARYDRARPLTIDPTVQILYSSYLGGAAESKGPVQLEQFSGITGNTPLTVADVGTDVALDPTNKAYMTGVAYSGAASFPLKNAFQSSQTGANSPPKQNPVGFIAKFDTTKSGASSLIYSTYIGGMGDTNSVDAGHGNGDLPFGIAVDASGEPFIVGQTYSTDFPDTASCGAFGRINDQKATDVNVGFVAKLNAAGSAIVYACYIDGKNNATESRVALFPAGCDATTTKCKAYISGSTQSDSTSGFPVTAGAFQKTLNTGISGKSNATFVVMHEDGQSLDYATLYGGSGNGTNADAGTGVAFDSSGHGYITGGTFSSDLTTKNPAVATYNLGASAKKVSNVFVAEFDPTLSAAASLLYATYLGGSGATGSIKLFGVPLFSLSLGDVATAIRIDPSTKHIWVAGTTASTDFQVPGKVSPVFESTNQAETHAGAPATAGFITELDPLLAGLNQVRYSTYFGGGGLTLVPTAPATGSIGVGDAIVDLATTGGTLLFVTGATASGTVPSGFPLSANACQTLNKSSGISIDTFLVPITAFASELDPSKATSAGQLIFSTLLGGSGTADAGTGLAIDTFGDMVISGLTYSGDFPATTTAFQSANGATGASATNAFLSVLYPLGTLCTLSGGTPVPTPSGSPSPSPSPSATPTPGGIIAISANPVIFPNAGLGGVPTHKGFLIQNLSAARHLVGNVGAPSAEFSIVSGGGAFDLGPLGVKGVKMLFTPTALHLQTGSLLATSNDKAHPSVVVNLRGTGVPGVPSLSIPALLEPPNPLAMTFGRVGIGVPGKTITLIIKNIGLGALGGTVTPLADPFAVTSPVVPFGPIPPGGVELVTVKFTPTVVGLATTTLTITTTNPNPLKHILLVPVSGTGVPGRLATNIPIATTFTSLNETLRFGAVSHGGGMKSLNFKIKNVAKGELFGSVPALGGTFTVTAGSGAFSLAPGATQTETVQFKPTSIGPFSVPLLISVTPPGRPASGITVTLKGKGT